MNQNKLQLIESESEIIKTSQIKTTEEANPVKSLPPRELYVIPEEILNPLKLLDLPNQVIRSSHPGSSLDVWTQEVEDEEISRRSSLISVLSTMYGYREGLDTNMNREFQEIVTVMRILTFVMMMFVICMIMLVAGIRLWVQ